MRVRWRLTKARHAAISFEVVEWSEQLRPVTSLWLGAVRRSVQVRLCTSGCKSEKKVWCQIRVVYREKVKNTAALSVRKKTCCMVDALSQADVQK